MSVLFSKRRLFVRQVVSAIVIFMVTFSAFSPAVFAQTEGASTLETVVCDDPNAQNNGDDEECEYETDGDNAFNSSGDDEDGTTTDSDNTGTSTDPLGNTATSTASSTTEANPNDGQDGTSTPAATSTATSTNTGTTGTSGANGNEGDQGNPGISANEADTGEPIPVISENAIVPNDGSDDGDESDEDTGGEIASDGNNLSIVTGPAKAQAELVNDINSNLVESKLAPNADVDDFDSYQFSATGTNYADVTTSAAASAYTGDNRIEDATGVSTIATGAAVAGVNIANIINSNVINSDGFLYLKNQVINAGQ